MAKSKKNTKLTFLSKFSKQQIIIALVFILGFGGFGVYKLAFSSAARPVSSSVNPITVASDQVASQYNVGKLIKLKGVSYWLTNKPATDPGYYVTSWRSKSAFIAGTAGTYRVCYKFATNKPADLIISFTISNAYSGGADNFTASQISSSDRAQSYCHDFLLSWNTRSDDYISTDLRITNDATLEITESSITKL